MITWLPVVFLGSHGAALAQVAKLDVHARLPPSHLQTVCVALALASRGDDEFSIVSGS